MTTLRLLAAFVLCSLVLVAPARSTQHEIEARVDPRVEFLTAVARLAGFREFDMPNSRSPYAERVEKHFAAVRGHKAIATLQELRAQSGVSHDAIPSLAVHLDGLEKLELRAPLEPWPERLDLRWEPVRTRRFLEELRELAAQTKAAEFFAGEQSFYAQVAARFREPLSRSRALEWFDSFFGVRPGAHYIATVGLLCGGRAYGVGVRLAGASREELTPVFGCWTFDEQGEPVFDDRYQSLFIHEWCHSYTNPFVDRHSERLRAAGERIFASCAEAMRKQSYGNWKAVLYESLVRASVIRCRTVLEGPQAGEQQAREELEHHFQWAPQLALRLGEYERRRATYATFEEFMPVVAAFFDEWAAKLPAADAKAPLLVSSEPANGAAEVDPARTVLVFEFDRAMRDQTWSVVGSGERMPKIVGKPSYDATFRRLSLPVQLEPGRDYEFSLNSERNRGFVSAEGVPLAPVALRFSTAEK